MRVFPIFLSLLVIMSVFPSFYQAYAEPMITVQTSQNTYHYGDHLLITINVSEITGDVATIYIICLLYTSPRTRAKRQDRMPSSA